MFTNEEKDLIISALSLWVVREVDAANDEELEKVLNIVEKMQN